MLKTAKTVQQEIDIQTPCWLYERASGRHYCINERGDIIAVGDKIIVMYFIEEYAHKDELKRVVNSAHSCTELEFKEALDKQLFNIQESVTG